MYKILAACKEQLAKYTENIAQAITKGKWLAVAKYAGLALTALLCILLLILALALALFSFARRILGPLFWVVVVFLMLMFLAPIIQFLLARFFGYKVGQGKSESATLDECEGIYGYVRDSVFLVLRDIAAYENIVIPSRASVIELADNQYSIEDGYVLFHFMCKVSGPLDLAQFKKDFERTLIVKHRAGELYGLPRTLVEINGGYYCPLLVLGNPTDLGDCIQISVTFANEKTVKLARARRQLNLDNIGRARRSRETKLTDDEL